MADGMPYIGSPEKKNKRGDEYLWEKKKMEGELPKTSAV